MKMKRENHIEEAERECKQESGGVNEQLFFSAQIMILMDVSQSVGAKKSARASPRE